MSMWSRGNFANRSVDALTEAVQRLGDQREQFHKVNKKAIFIVGAGLGIAAGVAVGYVLVRGSEQRGLTKASYDVQDALDEYLYAARNDNVSIADIEKLSSSLRRLEKYPGYESVDITLTAEELSILIDQTRDYAFELAKSDAEDTVEDLLSGDLVEALERLLTVQRVKLGTAGTQSEAAEE